MGDSDTMNAFENSLSDSAFHSIMTEQLYEACKGVGIKVYSDDECCRAMAWLLIYGGGNENVLSGSIFQVIKCAQSRLNLFGGELPNAELVPIFQEYFKSVTDENNPPEWVFEFEKKHNIKHRGC